jgi:hypothetical protein
LREAKKKSKNATFHTDVIFQKPIDLSIGFFIFISAIVDIKIPKRNV